MRTIAVIGLGYVGLGLAVALSKNHTVFGYDILDQRIEDLRKNIDKNQCVSTEELAECSINYTHNLADIKEADFYIVTVSTPAYFYELPNLEPLINATKDLATVIKKGDIIVFESTVYPGTTEDSCLPLLEKYSNLKCGEDFNIGYSPERIRPNDYEHTLSNMTKIVSAQNEHTLEVIKSVYGSICESVYPVSNLKTAEAIKVLENTQRDVNIAFMNEFTEIMHALGLDTHEIIEAAKTKFNFIPFKPGFVGGHCIAVDPHYLAFKAKRVGVKPDLILTARKINDNMPLFVVQQLNNILLRNSLNINEMKVGVFGITYLEDSPDIRNSLALKLLNELQHYGFHFEVNDPLADKKTVKAKYNIELKEFDELNNLSVAIIVVQHNFYRQAGIEAFMDKFDKNHILIDVPNLFADVASNYDNLIYWNL